MLPDGSERDALPYNDVIRGRSAGESGDAARAVLPSARAEPRPSGSSVSSVSSPHAVTVVAVLDRSDLLRMRVFHAFGAVAALAAIGLSLFLGGDPRARHLFWIGTSVLGACSVVLFYLATHAERYRTRVVSVLWLMANAGLVPAVAYFGPYSGVVMVNMLVLAFVSLGRMQWTALGSLAIAVAGRLVVALPILAGWTTDRGLLSSALVSHGQLWIAEVLVIGLLGSGYWLGCWARHMHTRALEELQRAVHMIGDKEQVLAEVAEVANRASRADEGRWTHHRMGSFKLGLVLGRGSMGEVYEAVRDDGTPAAVKLLNARSTASAAMVERFHREMAVAMMLESPNIVQVYELSAPDAPVPYLAMERLYGIDLASRLRAVNRIPSDEIVDMLDQIARGLEVARLYGVVHRDLKPHNLFLHRGTTWKVLDFGISKLLGREGTLTGDTIVGTPQYMAPEQAAGGDVSHLTDVYALGAIAYRCLTGRALFKGSDITELVYQVVHASPVRPSALGRVSPHIEDVLAVALAKEPRRRFPSARAFARAFVAARRGEPVEIDPPPYAWA